MFHPRIWLEADTRLQLERTRCFDLEALYTEPCVLHGETWRVLPSGLHVLERAILPGFTPQLEVFPAPPPPRVQKYVNFDVSTTWTVASDWYNIDNYLWGISGGAGGGADATPKGDGGGGGGSGMVYNRSLTPGSGLSITVGAGGLGNGNHVGANGGDTGISGHFWVVGAAGRSPGYASAATSAWGGGTGGVGTSGASGGGGGAGSPSGTGNSASGATGGAAQGSGGAGANGLGNATANGQQGGSYGGGGGGGCGGSPYIGGNGRAGIVQVVWMGLA